MAGLFNVSDSLFGGGESFSSVDSSLFMGFTNPPEAWMVNAPNISNVILPIYRIQGLEEKPSNNVMQIMQVWQHSPDLLAQAPLNHLS